MIRDHLLVFDDMLFTANSAIWTSDLFAERLGRYDQMAVQAVVDRTSGTGSGTLGVTLLHSSDGVNWLYCALAIDPTTTTINLNETDSFYGFVSPFIGLPFAKFELDLGGLITAAHVKLYAILRDPSD